MSEGDLDVSHGDLDVRYSRRRILALGASAGAGTFLLRSESAVASQGSDPVSTWVVARVESEPGRDFLEATVLPTDRPLHVSLSPQAPSTRPDGEPQTAFSIGQTFAAEGASRLEEDDTDVVALRLVPAVIGQASDVRR